MKNQLRSFAYDCVKHYSIFEDGQYCLEIDDLPDFALEEFAALMMSDEAFACEATGSDNPLYKSKMLPALLMHLKDPFNSDAQKDFMQSWRDGCANYHKSYLKDFIVGALLFYNADRSCKPLNDSRFVYQIGA